MATITSNASGAWATGGTWVGGVVPADNDAVVIAAGHAVLMNADLSAFTGLRTVTITSHATTPGMLYWTTGSSGVLKIRTGYNLVGTNAAAKGRLLANSNGTWGGTGALPYADKAVILLEGTSKIDALYLDIALYCTHPTNWYVETYLSTDVCADQTTGVNTTTGVITFASAPPTAGTAVRIVSNGTLPTGLSAEYIYYTHSVSGNTCKLALQNADAQIVIPSATGSGALTMYDGHTSTSTPTLNVVQDVTGDPQWTTTAGLNTVALVDIGPANWDVQRVTLAAIAASTIQLSANVDSIQYPLARIVLCSRNVSIRSSGTTAAQAIVDYGDTATHGGVFDCEITNTGGSGANYYGRAVRGGTGSVISGIVWGVEYACTGNYSKNYDIPGIICAAKGAVAEVCVGHTLSGVFCGIEQVITSGTQHTMSGVIFGCNYGVSGTDHTVSGDIYGCNYAISGGYGITFSGRIFSCGYGYIGNAGYGHSIAGSIRGCLAGISLGSGHVVTGTIDWCGKGIDGATGELRGATFANNGVDVALSRGQWRGYGAFLASGIQVNAYKYVSYPMNERTALQVLNLGGVDEALGAWTAGGFIKTETWVEGTHDPSGEISPDPTQVHVLHAEDSNGDCWMSLPLRAVSGQQVTVTVQGRLSGTAAWTERPVYAIADPAIGWRAVGELLDSETQANDTGWHTYTLTHTPDHDCELSFLVRAIGGDAAGTGTETLSFLFEIATGAGGTPVPRAWASVG